MLHDILHIIENKAYLLEQEELGKTKTNQDTQESLALLS